MSVFKKTCLFKNRSLIRWELLRQWRVVRFKRSGDLPNPVRITRCQVPPFKTPLLNYTAHSYYPRLESLLYLQSSNFSIPISLSLMFLPFFISLHPFTPSPQFLSLSKFAKSSSVSLPCFYSPPFLHYFEWDSCENRKCSGLSITSSLYPLPSPHFPPTSRFQTT